MHLHGHVPGASIELSKPDARGGRRHWSIRISGAKLETGAWVNDKPAKVTVKAYRDAQQAGDEYRKMVRAKMRDGYVFLRDRDRAGPGEIVFAGFISGGGGGVVLDLSPDGSRLVTAGCAGAPTSVWVELVDTLTGERRTVFERQDPQQIMLFSAQFDQTGQALVIAVGHQTLRLDLATGDVRELASYREFVESAFNVYVLRPRHDRSRRRFVVFDKGTIVRVIDERGEALLEVPMAHPTTECRAAGISPSGRLLALYRVSRHIAYGHANAARDTTNVVDVWDIDQGTLRETIALEPKLDRVGLDPRDERLITTWEYVQGPVVYALGSHEEVFRADQAFSRDRLLTLKGWDWSPDGTRFAAAGESVLREADLKTPVPVEDGTESEVVVFSADGALLLSAEMGVGVLRRTA